MDVKAQAAGLDGAAAAAPSHTKKIEYGVSAEFEPIASRTWQFAAGDWTELSVDPLGPDDDIDRSIEAAGYLNTFLCLADDDQPKVVVCPATCKTPTTSKWRYLISVESDGGLEFVFVPDLSDLALIAPQLAALASLLDRQEQSRRSRRGRSAEWTVAA
jgi:hypothetical protein